MFRTGHKTRKYSRSKSISEKKIIAKNHAEKKPWDWEADEITGLGYKRLLRSIILPETNISDSRDIGQSPDYREEASEWIGTLLLGVLYEVNHVRNEYLKLHQVWTDISLHPERYENGGYPAETNYKWPVREYNNITKAWSEVRVSLPVETYMEEVIDHIVRQMEDINIFPDEDFSPEFTGYTKQWLTLLFRVMAILLSNEHNSVSCLGGELKHILRKLIYIGLTWNLLDESELLCIRSVTEPIRTMYYRDYSELEEETSI